VFDFVATVGIRKHLQPKVKVSLSHRGVNKDYRSVYRGGVQGRRKDSSAWIDINKETYINLLHIDASTLYAHMRQLCIYCITLCQDHALDEYTVLYR